MSETPLRWGIVGCGLISHDFGHALAKGKHPHKVVACAAASSLERAQQFVAKNFPGATAYGSYDEILKDPNVDVIYVGVQNEEHCPVARKAIEAGKHVLVEKPFGTCAGEVRQTIEATKNRKTFFMEAFWSRFFPVWRYIRNVIETKELGEPRVFHANFGQPDSDRWRCKEHAETGLSMFGLYVIMLSHYVYQRKPEKVTVVGATEKKHETDAWATIVLEYGDNQRSVLYYDSRNTLPQTAYLALDDGKLELPGFFWCPDELIRSETADDKNNKRQTLDFPLEDDRFFNYSNSSGLRYEADHLYEQVQLGRTESEILPLKASLEIVETLDEIRRQLGVVYPHDERFK